MTSSGRIPGSEASTPRRRYSFGDGLTLLFFIGWCALGVVRTAHDVAEYRAEQAALATFQARQAQLDAVAAGLRAGTGAAASDYAPYDPTPRRWLIAEAAGYVLTLAAVLGWRWRTTRRREWATAQVKWVAPTREAELAVIKGGRVEPGSRSGAMAAGRLSVIVWNDRFARLERERA